MENLLHSGVIIYALEFVFLIKAHLVHVVQFELPLCINYSLYDNSVKLCT